MALLQEPQEIVVAASAAQNKKNCTIRHRYTFDLHPCHMKSKLPRGKSADMWRLYHDFVIIEIEIYSRW